MAFIFQVSKWRDLHERESRLFCWTGPSPSAPGTTDSPELKNRRKKTESRCFACFAAKQILPWAWHLELQPRTRLTPESKRPAKRPPWNSHFTCIFQALRKSTFKENPENLWVAFSILGLKVGSFASHISQTRKKHMRIMRIMRLIGFVDFLRVWRSL